MIKRMLLSLLVISMVFSALPAFGASRTAAENAEFPFLLTADAASKAKASFKQKSITVTAGEKSQLPVKWTKGKHGKVTYKVKDKCILHVSKKGKMTPLHPGMTSVTLKNADGKKSKIDVTINEPADMNNQVYLTFDDGPGSKVTPQLLDVLKKNNVKATFFVIGKNAEENKDLLKRAYDEGHTIGIHTYSHDYHQIYASEDAFLQDFHATEKVIKEVTGKKPRYFRFPGGGNNCYMTPEMRQDILHQLHREGYIEMDWNAATGDARGKAYSVESMVHISLDSRFGRGPVVILSHDENSKTLSPQVAGGVIAAYRAKGAEFRSLNEYYGPEMCLEKQQ